MSWASRAGALLGIGMGVAGVMAGPGPLAGQSAEALAERGRGEAPDTSEATQHRVDVGGYGSFRFDWNDVGGRRPSFTLRRFVLTTDARIGARLQVYSEIELERFGAIEVEKGVERDAAGTGFDQGLESTAGSELALEQAWAQLAIGRRAGVRFGAVLPPVGRFNLAHDDNLWDLPRRPLSVRGAPVLPAAAAWTEMGLGVVASAGLGGAAEIGIEAYLLNGVELDFDLERKLEARPGGGNVELEAEVSPRRGAVDGSSGLDAVAGRVVLSPRLGSEVAISGYVGRYTPAYLDADGTIGTLGLDGRHRLRGFDVEGELLYTRYSNVDGVARDFARVAIDHNRENEAAESPGGLGTEVEVELGGLARSRSGFWLAVRRPIPLPRGALGFEDATIAPIVRYERVRYDDALVEVDFSDGVVTSLEKADVEQGRLWIGVGFRPLPQAVVQLAYEYNRAIRGALIDPAIEATSTNGVTLGFAVGF